MPKRIIIVDDLAVNRKLLCGMLCKDYDITEASSGEEALKILKDEGDEISALLLDVVMPGMDGFDVLNAIRSDARFSTLPVIMVTASDDGEARTKALTLGANDFILKPYYAEVIKHCLKNNIALYESLAKVNALRRDILTGLYTRESFFEKVHELVSQRNAGYYIMACFDINKFKVINDQYGTERGDDVLKHIAKVFQEGFEANGGICCRISADDFAVLYPASFADSDIIADMRIKAGSFSGITTPITFSIGRYIVDDITMTPSAMFDRAMLANESVKGRYDEQIAYYNEGMRAKLLNEQQVVTEMSEALRDGQFEVWFQPQYNHSTRALIGSEALVRWRHPQKGLIPPIKFIPTFEKNGFIYSLDKYVWEEVCRRIAKWLAEGRNPLPVSVNVSRYDILRADVVETITQLTAKYAIPESLLRIEITESAFADSASKIVGIVETLVDKGYTVEIDDFGSGYSSLNTLKDVPAQIIKLDMKFFESGTSSRGGNIVESVVRMAKWLGMSVIAEGVETITQADYLRSVGCSYIQGYLYAKPMTAEEYEKLCDGAVKEEKLLTMETVENLNNNSFWDPNSMDTLIFNSYIGGACIFEYRSGNIELLRANEKYASVIGSAGMTVDDALKLNWVNHLSESDRERVTNDIAESIRTNKEVTDEYVFLDLPGCPHETYLRSSMRVIATAGDRYLVYCTNENITAQRLAEKKERNAAERLQSIMASVNSGISAVSVGDDGNVSIIFANERYYSITGYTKEQASAECKSIYDVVYPDDTHIIREKLTELIKTRVPCTYEYRCIKRDGSIIYLHSNASVTSIEGYSDNVVISVQTDITARIRAEQRAQKVSEQMQAIMDSVDIGITASTLVNGVVTFLFSNDRYYSIMGYTRKQYEDEVDDPFTNIYEDDRKRVIHATERAIESGKPAVIEYRVVRRDGRVIWLRIAESLGRFTGVEETVLLAIFRDITSEKETEQREKRASEQIQAIMNDIDSGITAAVMNNGKLEFLFSNDKYYEMHGFTREQYAAEVTDSYSLVYEDDREHVRSVSMNAYLTKTPARLEYRICRRDGEIRYMRVGLSSTHFTGIEQNVNLCIFTDITAEKSAERRVTDAAEQMKTLMNDIPGGFVRMRVYDDGRLTPIYFNEGFLKLTAMSYDELMDMYENDALAGVHPDDVEIVNSVIARMFENGEAHSSRYRLRYGKGGYIWLMIFGRVTHDDAGNTFLNVYYTDATEQVKAEEQRKELLDNLPYGAALYQLANNRLSVVHLNKRYWELVGRQPSADFRASFLKSVHPDDMKTIMEQLKISLPTCRDITCEIRILDGDSVYRLFHVAGHVTRGDDDVYSIYAAYTPITDEEIAIKEMLPITLQAMMSSQSDYIFVKDKNLKYICCSREVYEAIGLNDADEIIGKTDFEITDAATAQRYYDDDRRILENGESILDFIDVLPNKNGTKRYSSTSKYPLKDSRGNIIGIYGVGRDITETKDLKSRLELVTDSIPGGIASYECTESSIKLLYFNDGFCNIFGMTREEYQKRAEANPVSFVFDEDRAMLLEQIRKQVAEGAPIDCEYRVHTCDGGYRWVNHKASAADRQDGKVIINAIIQDITKRHELVDRLRQSEEESIIAVKLSGNVIARYDVAEQSLTIPKETAEANSLFEKLTGVPYEQVRLGNISPESTGAYIGFFEAIHNGEKNGKAIFCHRYFGGWKYLEAKSTTVFSTDGKPIKAIVSFEDVTERLEKETVYRKWQQSLEEREASSYTLFRCNLSKNASFDTVEGGLLHVAFDESKLGFNDRTLEYVSQCVYEADKQRYTAFVNSDTMLASYYRGKRTNTLEYREKLQDGGVRWIKLTVELVEYQNSTDIEAYLMYEDIDKAKQTEIRTKQLSESDPLTNVLNRTAFTIKVNDILSAKKPNALYAMLMLDIDGFKLVNDAFGHVIGDKTLIKTADTLKSVLRKSDLLCRLGGDEFLIFMTDIPENKTALAKAKSICAATQTTLSPEVQISSSIGIAFASSDGDDFDTLYKKSDAALYYVKGSGKNGFAVYSDQMEDEHLKPQDNAVSDSAGKKRRMLIVDDSEIDHEMLANIFAKDFIIEKARDGVSALIRLRHYGSAISVVLLDLVMPGMDGFAVLEKMRSNPELQSIPVVIVSGDESRETCINAVRNGATDFVTKPVDPDVIRIRVSSAISKAENEHLRNKNSLLESQNDERLRYETALEGTGIAVIEYDWISGVFTYYPSVSKHLFGVYDNRRLWQILLSDMVTDTLTVQSMQSLVHTVASDRSKTSGGLIIELKTASGQKHEFRMNVRKLTDDYNLTNKLIITLVDLEMHNRNEMM